MSSQPSATQTERERPFASSAALLGSLPGGALVVDAGGVVRQANPAAASLLGLRLDGLLGARLADLPGGAPLARGLEQPSGVCEVEGRALRFQIRPLPHDEGSARALGWLILLEDMAGEQAAKLQQYEYVSRALHDVRVPLQAIGGAAEGLMRGWFGPLADEQREFVGMIKENADRQGALFNQLFDVYTLSAGLVELHVERVRVEGVVREVAQEMAARFQSRGLDLSLVLPELPPAALADRLRLRQILVAMLDNACKYTCAGGAVIVRASEQAGQVRVDVQDTGVGIRAADQPKIFTPFFRGESPLKEGRYGGLSLAIARLLVELHGGRMWFDSVEAQGSTFSFILPATS